MIVIEFLKGDAPVFGPCTRYQAETYQVARELVRPGQRAKLSDVLDRLNLKTPAPFYSRLTHLQEKGYLRWGKSQTQAAIA